jgi:hypothetical protein
MAGRSLAVGLDPEEPVPVAVAVKEAVFPFDKFNVDIILGPEMRSTGEVMGFDESFGMAFAKAQIAGGALPTSGHRRVTVNDRDKPTVTPIVRRFHELGFEIRATGGTARYLRARGVPPTHLQGGRGPAEHRRRHHQRRGPAPHQHAAGQEVPVRRLRHAPHRHRLQDPVLHHHVRRIGGRGRGHRTHAAK